VHAEPEMKDLIIIAVPELKAYWEDVAYILDYKTPAIDAIKEKYHADPNKCCRELLRDWLEANRGAEKKTWFTLLNSIGADKDFTKAIEVILEELEKNVVKCHVPSPPINS